MTNIDRRRFLTYTGAAGAAAGAAWAAPSVLGTANAFAAGSCLNRDQINWAAYANGSLSTTNGDTFELTPDRIHGPDPMDYVVTMTVTPVGNVASREAKVNVGNAFGNKPGIYELGMTGDAAGAVGDYGWDVILEWPSNRQAYLTSWELVVVDERPVAAPDGYKDYVYVDSTRWLYNPFPAWIQGAGTSTNPWTGVNGEADKTRNLANIVLEDSLSTGLSSIQLHFRGDPTYYGLFQAIGIANLTWCL